MTKTGYTFRRIEAGLHEIPGTGYRLERESEPIRRRAPRCWTLRRGDDLVEIGIRTVKEASDVVRFVEGVLAYLREIGAAENTEKFGRMYPWALETRLGTLIVSIHGGWVAMRFVDVDRAAKDLTRNQGLNTYSGKWNYHPSREDDVEDRLRGLKYMLSRVTEGIT